MHSDHRLKPAVLTRFLTDIVAFFFFFKPNGSFKFGPQKSQNVLFLFLFSKDVFVFITLVWNCVFHSSSGGPPHPPPPTPSHLQGGGGWRGRGTEPASLMSSEGIGQNWQCRPCKENTRIVFSSLFFSFPKKAQHFFSHLPVKYYRSFMWWRFFSFGIWKEKKKRKKKTWEEKGTICKTWNVLFVACLFVLQ